MDISASNGAVGGVVVRNEQTTGKEIGVCLCLSTKDCGVAGYELKARKGQHSDNPPWHARAETSQ